MVSKSVCMAAADSRTAGAALKGYTDAFSIEETGREEKRNLCQFLNIGFMINNQRSVFSQGKHCPISADAEGICRKTDISAYG